MKCPLGTLFDEKLSICNFAYNVDCNRISSNDNNQAEENQIKLESRSEFFNPGDEFTVDKNEISSSENSESSPEILPKDDDDQKLSPDFAIPETMNDHTTSTSVEVTKGPAIDESEIIDTEDINPKRIDLDQFQDALEDQDRADDYFENESEELTTIATIEDLNSIGEESIDTEETTSLPLLMF